MRDARYTQYAPASPVPPGLRKAHLVQEKFQVVQAKIQARRRTSGEINASYVKFLQQASGEMERQTSGIHLAVTALHREPTQQQKDVIAERATVLEIPAIAAPLLSVPVTQASPQIDFCGSMIEYRDPLHKPGYLSLTGAVVEFIKARKVYPRALIVASDILPVIEFDIASVDGSYDGMFYFRKDAIRVMTEKNIPSWLFLVLNGSIPRDIVYAIA